MNLNGLFSAQTFRQDIEIIHFMWFEHTDGTCSWVGYYSSSKLRC